MTVGQISLSSSTQANLTALQNTAKLLQGAQSQLSTGNAVNAPSDNATAFYAAQAFLQSANDLASLKDNISTAITTVASTTQSIGSASQVVQQLQGIATQALSTNDASARAALATQYNQLRTQLDGIVNDSTVNGTNLLNGSSNNLTVPLSADGTSSVTINAVNATSDGLNIAAAQNNFASNADITAATSQLSTALATLNTDASTLGSNATLLQTNQDFTANLTNNLQDAAGNLTGADINAEAAGLLALQAQNQLGIVSLSITAQASQNILQLFKA